MGRLLPAVVCVLLGVFSGCAASGGVVAESPQPLVRPSQLAEEIPHRACQVSEGGRLQFGAHRLETAPWHRVYADGHRLDFRPAWGAGPGNSISSPAVAYFGFDATGFTGDMQVALEWEGDPPDPANVYIGLGNFTTDTWDWSAEGLLPGEPADYIDDAGRLLAVVVLLGEDPAQLNWIRIGEPYVVAGVDLTLLYAPPLGFETQAVEDGWDSRDTGPHNFTIVAEETDGELFRTMVVSHEVAGETHYGFLRIPPYGSLDAFGVLVYCHGGSKGAYDTDLFNLDHIWINSTHHTDNCIVVMPSFRGETIFAGGLGDHTSEGASDVYDTDADDALALLNCVLDEFNSADPDRIIVMGVSRGAQVAQRMGQRDSRIAAVVDCYGVTDDWLPGEQDLSAYDLEQAEAGTDITGYPWGAVLEGLRRGTTDIWAAREFLLKRSTVYYAGRYPRLQVHHGTNDASVRVAHSDRLAEVLAEHPETGFEYFRYDGGTHNLSSLPGSDDRIGALVDDVLGFP